MVKNRTRHIDELVTNQLTRNNNESGISLTEYAMVLAVIGVIAMPNVFSTGFSAASSLCEAQDGFLGDNSQHGGGDGKESSGHYYCCTTQGWSCRVPGGFSSPPCTEFQGFSCPVGSDTGGGMDPSGPPNNL